VNRTVGVDDMEKRKFCTTLGLELQPLSRPVHIPAVLRINFTDLWNKYIDLIRSILDEIATEYLLLLQSSMPALKRKDKQRLKPWYMDQLFDVALTLGVHIRQ
jgi:hypothetical protein